MMFLKTYDVWATALGLAALGCGAAGGDAQPTVQQTNAALSGGVELIAIGTIDGHQRDRSKKTQGALENGMPGNLLGGVGSGLSYLGENTFLAVPDRGPNAAAYNDAVNDTVTFIPRIQTFKMRLTESEDAGALPFALEPQLQKTTLLYSREPLVYGTGEGLGVGDGTPALNKQHVHYFTGRSDAFDPSRPSSSPSNGRLDPESIRASNDGEHVYISDEYGPYLYEFERATGRRTRVFELPSQFAVPMPSPQKSVEIADNTTGRVANKGMEGIAISPDGSTLFGCMQSPLLQDGGKGGRFVRIVKIDIGTGAIEQYAYELTNIGSASKPKFGTVSDIVAVNDHALLVDERDGKGLGDDSAAAYKMVYHVDLSGAADVSGLTGEAALQGHAIAKALFIDLVAAFNAHGIASTEIPSKLEGLAFGPDVTMDGVPLHTLFISDDNDFTATVVDTTHPDGIDNPNTFFVFGIEEAALPGYVPQQLDRNPHKD